MYTILAQDIGILIEILDFFLYYTFDAVSRARSLSFKSVIRCVSTVSVINIEDRANRSIRLIFFHEILVYDETKRHRKSSRE